MVAASGLIRQQPRGPVVVENQDVRVSIVVDISKRRSATHFRQLEHGPGGLGHFLKLAVSQIPEQLIGLVQWIRIFGPGQRLNPFDVSVDSQNIQQAIVVEIEKRRAESGKRNAGKSQSAQVRGILERGLSPVDIEG